MSAPPRARPRLPYYPALDGFRAAALSVMLFFHAGFEWASGAFLSISAFFTLSGFLITGLLLLEYEGTGRIALLSFWERRFRRLMPAAILGLLGMSLFAATVADPAELMQIRGDTIAALFYVANWRFIWTGQSYARILTDPSPVQHFWSLGIEEQFYVFFPILMLAILAFSNASRRVLASVLTFLLIASTVTMVTIHSENEDFSRVYYGTDTRAAELLAGALLAIGYAGRPLDGRRWVTIATNVVGSLCLIGSVWLWVTTPEGANWFFEGGALVYSLMTAAIIVGAIRPGPLQWLLSIRVLCWAGWITYGLYIFHWPVFLWLDPQRTGLSPWPLFALRMLVTTAVAAGSYVLVEVPIRTRRLLPGKRAWIVGPAAAAVVVLAIVGVSDRLYRPGLDADQATSEERLFRDESRFRILFLGDSLGHNLAVGMSKLLHDMPDVGLQTVNQGRPGCGFARGGERRLHRPLTPTYRASCWRWEQKWPALLDKVRPHAVVVAVGVWDLADIRLDGHEEYEGPGDPRFDAWIESEYAAAVEILVRSGAHVFWATYPCIGGNSGAGTMFEGSGALSNDRIRYVNETILPRLQARFPDDLTLLPLFDKACPDGTFTQELAGESEARRDGLHFRKPEARWVASWMLDWLASAGPAFWQTSFGKDLDVANRPGWHIRACGPPGSEIDLTFRGTLRDIDGVALEADDHIERDRESASVRVVLTPRKAEGKPAPRGLRDRDEIWIDGSGMLSAQGRPERPRLLAGAPKPRPLPDSLDLVVPRFHGSAASVPECPTRRGSILQVWYQSDQRDPRPPAPPRPEERPAQRSAPPAPSGSPPGHAAIAKIGRMREG